MVSSIWASFIRSCFRVDASPRDTTAQGLDHGFVLSDHADWPGILDAIDATGAETVYLTHGYTSVVARWLQDQGKNAHIVTTLYEGERDERAFTR